MNQAAEVSKEQEVETETENKEAKQINLDNLKIAYVAGMTQEGNFVFEIFGCEKGILELLGLHYYATHRISNIYNINQISGDALIHEVGKAVGILNQKADKLVKILSPSDNEIILPK